MAKTSIHIKPCNIGQSEAHNKRTKEYLAHINADKLYIREDLTSCNQSWIAEQQQGLSLQLYYDNIGKMVKEKTGRAMQTKEHHNGGSTALCFPVSVKVRYHRLADTYS